MTKHISIIVPVWNEEGNIIPLAERIHSAMKDAELNYTLIFVDDRSKDKTVEVIQELASKYPIQLLRKKPDQKRGKALSLLAGFAYAKTDIVVMIDADLQYPPEAIAKMVTKIDQGADVVIANRRERRTGLLRKWGGEFFRFVFGEFLHGFNFDVQSGLKVFRKEIIERISIKPSSQWMFDLEFLIAAKHGGYKFDHVSITFEPRHSGRAKISFVKASMEMALGALRLKTRQPKPIPFHPNQEKMKGKGFHFEGTEYINHTDLPYHETAFHRLTLKQILIVSGIFGIIAGGLMVNWHATLILLVAGLSILYFSDLLFNLFLIYRSFAKAPEMKVSEEEITAEKDNEWPTYTIFCPLYKEWQVLPQFVTAMSRMEYPKDKLQVMLLLEEDDKETIKNARAMNLPKNFEIVVVPHSYPKTKPKASNYGLTKARGEYIVIYDAEDVPDPLQLKKAVIAFRKAGPQVICIQAKLNFYNPHHNLLTKLFTAEYSLWFDLVLTGLQSIHAPIPLGGTSNHFRTDDLKMLKGWDSFNVTEDCDLGMRLVKRGFRTAIMESTTHEEANSDLANWFNQRSRWIKGYIQSYFVHMRRPGEFIKHWKEPHALTFQLVVGGKIFSLFINPFMWVLTIVYFALRPIVGEAIESLYPAPVFYMALFSLVLGNFLYVYYYMIGCAKREHDDIIKYVFIVPIYWLFMSAAAWKALYGMITKPHYWAKTKHGLHLGHKKAEKQATSVLGKDLVDGKIATSFNLRLNRI